MRQQRNWDGCYPQSKIKVTLQYQDQLAASDNFELAAAIVETNSWILFPISEFDTGYCNHNVTSIKIIWFTFFCLRDGRFDGVTKEPIWPERRSLVCSIDQHHSSWPKTIIKRSAEVSQHIPGTSFPLGHDISSNTRCPNKSWFLHQTKFPEVRVNQRSLTEPQRVLCLGNFMRACDWSGCSPSVHESLISVHVVSRRHLDWMR